MTRQTTTSLLLLIAPLIAAAASGGDGIVAEIGHATISRDAFVSHLNELRHSGDASQTLKTLSTAGREDLLNALIDQQLYALAARDRRLDQSPATRQAIEQAVSEILASAFRQHELENVSTTEARLREYYDAHLDQFTSVRRVKARHVLLKTRSEADDVRRALSAGADFAALATERSIDRGTGLKGGDLGWVSAGTMVKAFNEALFRLKPHEISDVVESTYGYHVITVEEVADRSVEPFVAVKERVRGRLIADHFEQVKVELRTEHPVKIHGDVLESLNK
jgi:parvulin-like peptidyl-prolyl isomerase